jgi:hypothetical protein
VSSRYDGMSIELIIAGRKPKIVRSFFDWSSSEGRSIDGALRMDEGRCPMSFRHPTFGGDLRFLGDGPRPSRRIREDTFLQRLS